MDRCRNRLDLDLSFRVPANRSVEGQRKASECVCVRPSINARSLVCTQNSRGSLYRNNGEGKFVRLQRKEGFARGHDTPRGAALIHANTSDRERERESTVFVFVSWA